MNQRLSFLAHTRSRSFDYGWIYGLHNRDEERILSEFILTSLGVRQLADLPPVSTFFRYGDSLVMLRARQSQREDRDRRAIFERSLFYWRPSGPIFYRDLRVIYLRLLDLSNEVFAQVPDDEVRAPKQVKEIDIELGSEPGSFNLPDKSGGNESPWVLPGELSPEILLKRPLVVEVPSGWTFCKLLHPISDLPINVKQLISLGCSISTLRRFGDGMSWIISPVDEGACSSFPRILDEKGEDVPLTHLKDLVKGLESSQKPQTDLKVSVASEGVPGAAGARKENSLPPLLEALAEKDASISPFSGDSVKDRMVRNLGFGQDSILRDALLRLSELTIPVGLDTEELSFAWINLLNEISFFQRSCSKDMGRHWIQRLEFLERLSLDRYGERSREWAAALRFRCAEVIDLIGF